MVTGGAGFIGSNFVSEYLGAEQGRVIVLDKFTYAANLANLEEVRGNPRLAIKTGDIGDRNLVGQLLAEHEFSLIINFAGETHVDRSILWPADFIDSNVVGVYNLLDEIRTYWQTLRNQERAAFRFVHLSTDEVYGSLPHGEAPCLEGSAYQPSSPYAASKAAADHLIRAYHHTYGMPTLIANCSNTYGPRQYPEKLIPLTILRCLQAQPVPVYGDGGATRDWLYIEDVCDAIRRIAAAGVPGETYHIGGSRQETVLEVARLVCDSLDRVAPRARACYRELITHVTDRPGHDRRYALNSQKLTAELGWQARESLESGVWKTVNWYVDHRDWLKSVVTRDERLADWLVINYGRRERL